MKGKHVTKEERFCIEKLIHQRKTYREIATTLGRSLGTIHAEIQRNGGKEGYTATKAYQRAYGKQYRKKRTCNKVAMDPFLRSYIEKKLRLLWSPERISGRLRYDYGSTCSAKSIRKYIASRGYSLEQYLFWVRTKKKTGPKRRTIKERLANRTFIEARPVTEGIGHWEGDFIVSRHNKEVLLVLTDIESTYTHIRKLPERNNALVNQCIESTLGPYERKTLTLDNDIAFQQWEQLSFPVYFTHPYCSWEKGLVENTNRWIRSFLPKRTDFKKVSFETISSIEQWLNHTPRQCLNYKTPYEVYTESVQVKG